MLEYLALVVAIHIYGAMAYPLQTDDNGYYVVPNDTVQCVNDLIEWCDDMKYPQEGAGMSMISVTIAGPGGFCEVFCTSDYDGTNCTRKGLSWLSCSKDNKLFYKRNPLSKDSTDGADEDICKAADNAFNDIYVQNLSYNNETIKTELEKGMESFFGKLAIMQEQINTILRKLSFFDDDFDDFLFDDRRTNATTLSSRSEGTIPGRDQIEKE